MASKKNNIYIILCIVLLVVILVSFLVIWIYINNNLQTKTTASLSSDNLTQNFTLDSNGCHMDSEGCNKCCYVTNMNTGEKKEVCTAMDCIVNGKSVYDKKQ